MKTFREISIEQKLTVIGVLTSGIVLLLAGAAFLTYDVISFRRSLVNDMSTLSDVIGANCTAALMFNDADDAEEILSGLKAKEYIVNACVYSADGKPFALYTKTGISKVLSSVHFGQRCQIKSNATSSPEETTAGPDRFRARKRV